MHDFKFSIDPSSGKRIISDVVAPPRKEITTQLFRSPPSSITQSGGVNRRRLKLIGLAVIVLLAWAAISFATARMEVTLTPKKSTFLVDRMITLNKEPAGPDELVFNTVALSRNKEGEFKTREKKFIEKQASGHIVVFNKSTKDPQTLVAITRFETPDGKIYRTPKRVSIPGYIVRDGKIIPGSLEIKVIADKPGEDYNIGLSDFTIPGFKGSLKYKTIFARSKTVMTGGFKGVEAVVGEEDVDEARSKLGELAKQEALSVIQEKMPPGALLLQPSMQFNIINEVVEPEIGDAGGEFTLKINGEARGAFVDRSGLENILILDSDIQSYFGGYRVRVNNLESLNMALFGYKFEGSIFRVRVRGDLNAEAVINAEEFKNGLIERGIYNSESILSAFPEVTGAQVRFRPFWLKRLPGNPSRIDIVLQSS